MIEERLLTDPLKTPVPKQVLTKVPAKVARYYHVFPIRMDQNKVVIASNQPADSEMVQDLRTILGDKIKIAFAERWKIDEAIQKHYGVGASLVQQLRQFQKESSIKNASGTSNGPQVDEMEVTAGEISVRELVNQFLIDAQKKRASDVHIEPFCDSLSIRYRIDGILQEASVPEEIRQFQGSIVSRIKIMANLDISERRLPQDGRIKIRIEGKELDLRVSVLPTAFGESLAIRILSPARLLMLDGIGLSERHLKKLREIIRKPWGVVLLTGPTGSGKTTTLCACLNELNEVGRKIITVEDPVEYQLKGIIQMQVHPKIGLTFAQGLKHMLRHDPDVMMVGEIRDPETAEIAIRSSLTGHLVFSTLHTNGAPSAAARLADLNVEPYLVASSLECVMAQRLVRLICQSCKQKMGSGFIGAGCDRCAGSGFYGRTAIYEFLVMDEELKDMLGRHASTRELRETAIKKGMTTLREDGLAKVNAGLTTEAEVLRVVTQEISNG